MADFKILMPKMGESVQEATITKWFVKEGDRVEEDDMLFEIATEKVDSEIPSPVDGVVKKVFFDVDAVVAVGEVLAILEVEGEGSSEAEEASEEASEEAAKPKQQSSSSKAQAAKPASEATRFYSPLVRSIAKKEGISMSELETISGRGMEGRVQKQDVLDFLQAKQSGAAPKVSASAPKPAAPVKAPVVQVGKEDTVIEMDRVRKIIAARMIQSVQTAPHVMSAVETDMTPVWNWREKNKKAFEAKYGEKLTFMPIFVEAVAQALREHPMVNASVDGDKIILRAKVNIGMAVAKPDGNLIVPVITDADQKNIAGLAASVNDLANRARINKLKPDEISGGTFSISNFGSFKNDIGSPIINQPEVAILGIGNIKKKPAVIETPEGDMIAIRRMMWISMSYDHRIIDGALGGAFVKRVSELIENFDVSREI
ncbi:MAG: dihydrolipoamide acetyltransferase family protein [Mangrovibacterium sp.]